MNIAKQKSDPKTFLYSRLNCCAGMSVLKTQQRKVSFFLCRVWRNSSRLSHTGRSVQSVLPASRLMEHQTCRRTSFFNHLNVLCNLWWKYQMDFVFIRFYRFSIKTKTNCLDFTKPVRDNTGKSDAESCLTEWIEQWTWKSRGSWFNLHKNFGHWKNIFV